MYVSPTVFVPQPPRGIMSRQRSASEGNFLMPQHLPGLSPQGHFAQRMDPSRDGMGSGEFYDRLEPLSTSQQTPDSVDHSFSEAQPQNLSPFSYPSSTQSSSMSDRLSYADFQGSRDYSSLDRKGMSRYGARHYLPCSWVHVAVAFLHCGHYGPCIC